MYLPIPFYLFDDHEQKQADGDEVQPDRTASRRVSEQTVHDRRGDKEQFRLHHRRQASDNPAGAEQIEEKNRHVNDQQFIW